jgi:hypothetical protein
LHPSFALAILAQSDFAVQKKKIRMPKAADLRRCWDKLTPAQRLFPLWEQFPVFQNQPALLTEKAPAFSVCVPDSSCRFAAAEKEKKERICSYDYYLKKRYRPAKSQ